MLRDGESKEGYSLTNSCPGVRCGDNLKSGVGGRLPSSKGGECIAQVSNCLENDRGNDGDGCRFKEYEVICWETRGCREAENPVTHCRLAGVSDASISDGSLKPTP